MSAPPSLDASALPALADRCVQCGLCLPHCPTYRLDASEAESPRGRIAYARAVATGQLAPTPVGDHHLDHCLGCLRCEQACPAEVDFGRLLLLARSEQARRRRPGLGSRGRLALLARPRLLARLLGSYRRIRVLLPPAWRLLPLPPRPVTPSPNRRPAPAGSVAVFEGCVAGVYESNVRAALRQCLERAGLGVEAAPRQTCCGTAAAHAGDAAAAEKLAKRNREAFAGHPVVLSLASGCREILRSSLQGQSQVVDAFVFLSGVADRLAFRSAAGRRALLHLPCSQSIDTDATKAMRALLARVPDLDLQELPDSGCCGAAGMHMFDEPLRAARLRQPLLDALAGNAATELLSANIGCRLHLQNGTTMTVRHPIEFLAEHLA